jgi:peptidoglycan/xylan/chitin deacetylase (PgdA/CDA1 family)
MVKLNISRRKLIIAILMAVAAVLAIPVLSRSSKQQIKEAENSVKNLFYGQATDFLSKDISQNKISAAEQKVQNLRPERKDLMDKINLAKNKLAIISDLTKIYNLKQPIIQSDTVAKYDFINEKLGKLLFDSLRSRIDNLPSDSFKQKALDIFNPAELSFLKFEKINLAISEFSKYNSENNLESLIIHFKNTENILNEVKNQPQFNELNQKMNQEAEIIGQKIQDKMKTGENLENISRSVLDSERLAVFAPYFILPAGGIVALTFDDGPNPNTTPQILDILKKNNVKATFFVIGKNAERYPEIIKRIMDEGHLIGNHSYSHIDFSRSSDAAIREEITKTQEIIKNASGVTPHFYRMPYGSGGQRVVNLLQPLKSVLWNVDSEDWKLRNTNKILDQVARTMKPQSVILFHDIYPTTVESVNILIPALKQKGYNFVFPQDL